jgi:hypothetical protein
MVPHRVITTPAAELGAVQRQKHSSGKRHARARAGDWVLRRRAALAHRHSIATGNYVTAVHCSRVPFGLVCVETEETRSLCKGKLT